jgi:DNA replication protein DnaC
MGEREGTSTHVDDHLQRVLERCGEFVVSDEEIARFEAQQGERDRRDRIESSGIGEHLDESGAAAIIADRPTETRALALVRTWLISSRPMLVLTGPPGVGKTVAAAWALSRLPGRYARAQELCEMRENWRERARWATHLRCEILVVDELGLERDPALAKETLQDVVDKRQRTPRRTLLLGNLDKAGLVARYDARTLDRLGIDDDASGIAILRSLKGESLRRAR